MEYINSKVFKHYSITFNNIVGGGGLETSNWQQWGSLKTETSNFLLHFLSEFGGIYKIF